jgi:hypothetical protein
MSKWQWNGDLRVDNVDCPLELAAAGTGQSQCEVDNIDGAQSVRVDEFWRRSHDAEMDVQRQRRATCNFSDSDSFKTGCQVHSPMLPPVLPVPAPPLSSA